MRVPEEPVCMDLFRQNPVFTSLHLKYPVHVVPPQEEEKKPGIKPVPPQQSHLPVPGKPVQQQLTNAPALAKPVTQVTIPKPSVEYTISLQLSPLASKLGR
jgi:hypothetical protein